MVSISLSGGYYLSGYIGDKAQKVGYVSEEPFNEKTLLGYIWSQLKSSE